MSNTFQKIEKQTETICFAGDSGDGIQTIGSLMTLTSAATKNDVQTIADFPSDIRSPAGSLYGVSTFQMCISQNQIYTAGDNINTLLAFNPAALKTNIKNLKNDGIIIIDKDKFSERDYKKAKYESDPLASEEIKIFKLIGVPITTETVKSLSELDLSQSLAKKSKNFYALGLLLFLYNKPIDITINWIKTKFKDKTIQNANTIALQAGFNYLNIAKIVAETYIIKPADLPKGKYKQITGNQGFSNAILALATCTKSEVFVASYPITPASEIFNELCKNNNLGVITFQAEDEIAAISAVIGAAFGGKPAITCTSGPGFDLIQEALGLAVMAELPLVTINVQRAGPSTGMPTKTEQADLLSVLYGRHGEAPLIVLAAKSPSDCFDILLKAYSLAVKYMTPVVILSDANIACCQEPWLIPNLDKLPEIKLNFVNQTDKFNPYERDPKTLARNWTVPGIPGNEHIIGGLEKEDITGQVSYESENHQKMCELRKSKIENVANDIPKTIITGKNKGKLLVVSWGSLYGPVKMAMESLYKENESISCSWIHLQFLNPLPKDLNEILINFENILIPEKNLGQLNKVLAANLLNNFTNNTDKICKFHSFHKITGQTFKIKEIKEKILQICK